MNDDEIHRRQLDDAEGRSGILPGAGVRDRGDGRRTHCVCSGKVHPQSRRYAGRPAAHAALLVAAARRRQDRRRAFRGRPDGRRARAPVPPLRRQRRRRNHPRRRREGDPDQRAPLRRSGEDGRLGRELRGGRPHDHAERAARTWPSGRRRRGPVPARAAAIKSGRVRLRAGGAVHRVRQERAGGGDLEQGRRHGQRPGVQKRAVLPDEPWLWRLREPPGGGLLRGGVGEGIARSVQRAGPIRWSTT